MRNHFRVVTILKVENDRSRMVLNSANLSYLPTQEQLLGPQMLNFVEGEWQKMICIHLNLSHTHVYPLDQVFDNNIKYIYNIITFFPQEDFTSLGDYIAWEYTDNYTDTEHQLNEQQLQLQRNKRKFTITFSEDYILPLEHKYQLLYFHSTGTRGVTGLIGMSNAFSVQRRRPTLSFDDID